MFPNLLFGKDVERQLHVLSADLFRDAVGRLTELDRTASEWKTSANPNPTYLSKVTAESVATMQRHGQERVFCSSLGRREAHEKHARIREYAEFTSVKSRISQKSKSGMSVGICLSC